MAGVLPPWYRVVHEREVLHKRISCLFHKKGGTEQTLVHRFWGLVGAVLKRRERRSIIVRNSEASRCNFETSVTDNLIERLDHLCLQYLVISNKVDH